MNRLKFFCAALALVSVLTRLQAQPVNVQQFQNIQQAQQFQQPLSGQLARTNAPELYPIENTDTGPQQILHYTPRTKYFDVMLDSQFFYSDNANFSGTSGKIGSAVYVNTAQFSFMPPERELGPGKFSGALGFVSQWYNYGNDDMSALDFNAQTFFGSARYSVNNWQFGAGLNFTRLLSQDDYAQTYEEWLPALSVQRYFPINEKLLFAVGNQVDYHFSTVPEVPGSSTEINNRFDETVSLTMSWQLTHDLTVQPFYSFQYSNYRNNTLQTSGRNDCLNSFGLTLCYYFTPNFSMRTFFSGNIKWSDDDQTASYHEYNEGLGATFTFKF